LQKLIAIESVDELGIGFIRLAGAQGVFTGGDHSFMQMMDFISFLESLMSLDAVFF
jgi:hypothetical protein